MGKRILLCMGHMGGFEKEYVLKAIEDNWVVPLGPDVDAFEQDLAHFLGQNVEVTALTTGTGAVHVALSQIGVKPGDEVICQTFTFCASCNPIRYLGGIPVFVDSERDTWNMDPVLLEAVLEDRIQLKGHKPKAIVVADLYGMPAKLDEIVAVADKFEIPVVEDAAEAFGSEYKGRKCGTFGRFGILSFNGNKMITTSGGGALVCHNSEDRRRAMFFATQAREAYPYYQHEEIGYNYRMSNICAAIGRGQMRILDQHIAHHRKLAEIYRTAFEEVKGITFHANPTPDFDSNYWLSTIILDENLRVKGEERAYTEAIGSAIGGAGGTLGAARGIHTSHEPNRNVEAMRLGLLEHNVESRPLWKPLHLQPIYSEAPRYLNGVCEEMFRTGLCIPSGPYVSEEDAHYIVGLIKDLIKR